MAGPRELVWLENSTFAAWGCSACNWIFFYPGVAEEGKPAPPVLQAFDEHECGQFPRRPHISDYARKRLRGFTFADKPIEIALLMDGLATFIGNQIDGEVNGVTAQNTNEFRRDVRSERSFQGRDKRKRKEGRCLSCCDQLWREE